jgi:hypothetical protein
MGIFTALMIAILISLIFSPYRGGSIVPLVIFFLLLFMAGIAGMFWIVPFGPAIGGVALLPILFPVIMFALLISLPSPDRRVKKNINEEEAETRTAVAEISLYAWLLFGLLLIAIMAGVYRLIYK